MRNEDLQNRKRKLEQSIYSNFRPNINKFLVKINKLLVKINKLSKSLKEEKSENSSLKVITDSE